MRAICDDSRYRKNKGVPHREQTMIGDRRGGIDCRCLACPRDLRSATLNVAWTSYQPNRRFIAPCSLVVPHASIGMDDVTRSRAPLRAKRRALSGNGKAERLLISPPTIGTRCRSRAQL